MSDRRTVDTTRCSLAPGTADHLDELLRVEVRDDQLRLIFTVCHPALAPETRVAPALNIYSIFTAGHHPSEGALDGRIDLCDEAIRLAELAHELALLHNDLAPRWHLFWATRGDLLRRLDDLDGARDTWPPRSPCRPVGPWRSRHVEAWLSLTSGRQTSRVRIDLQLNSAIYDWPSMRDGVLAAEAAGFGTFWAVDHLSGEPMGGSSMFECFSLLGALASITETIGLGSMVANVFNRPAGTLAAAAATVQSISDGRFSLGLGAGAAPGTRWSREHEALGIALLPRMADRHRVVAETLDLLDAAWRADRGADFETMPRPVPRPSVMLGVNSRELAQLAGRRCEMVNVRGGHPQARELLEAAGPHIERSVWEVWDPAMLDPEHPRRRELAGWGVTRLILSALRERIPLRELEQAAVWL